MRREREYEQERAYRWWSRSAAYEMVMRNVDGPIDIPSTAFDILAPCEECANCSAYNVTLTPTALETALGIDCCFFFGI